MEHYLKALQCDVQQINNITGLHIAQFILWPEVITMKLVYSIVLVTNCCIGNDPCEFRSWP